MKRILLFVISVLFMWPIVKADTVNLVNDRFNDMYSYYYDNNQGKYRYLEASKYSFGGNVAYCLEIGQRISNIVYEANTSFDSINISSSDMDYIKLISYYGYDYPRHDTNRYYLATQELIWNRLINESIRWTNGFNPESYTDVSYEKEEILKLYRKHNVMPSFNNSVIDFYMGDELVLEDSNNVLSMYTSDNKDVVISGNRLIIKSDFKDREIVLNRVNYNKKNFLLYTSGSSQKMMSSGGINLNPARVSVNLYGGRIGVLKLDADTNSTTPSGEGSLNGTKYGLYDKDENLIDTFVIGEKDYIDNLPLSKYYIKELKAGLGYLIDDNIYEINLTRDLMYYDLVAFETIMKRRVDIFKVFGSGNTEIMDSEANVIFDIYDYNNNLFDSITTDDDGHAFIYLPFGSYVFKQRNSSEGYEKVDDFKINILNNDDRPIYKLISDTPIKTRVRVVKKDSSTNDMILNSGVRFKLFDVKNDKFIGYNNVDGSIVYEFSVGDDGTLLFPMELSYGKYILYEVDDYMNGYLYNRDGYEFSIDDNMTTIYEEGIGNVLEVSYFNKKVTGKIIINKYGEDIIYKNDNYYYKDIYLSDVVFNLYSREDIYDNGNLIYEKDSLVKTCTSNDGGVCLFDKLLLGKYYLSEISSSNDNVIDDNIYDIELEYKDQYTSEIIYEKDIYNYLRKGELVINKFDSNSNERLSNTLVEVRDSLDRVVYKGYTDNNGQIIIKDLLYGKYYLSEIESSSGYKILSENVYFDIDSGNKEINLYNERINVPSTGSNVVLYNIISMFAIIFGVIVCIVFLEDKRIVVISSIVSILGFIYIGMYFYNYLYDTSANKKMTNLFLEGKISYNSDSRYNYKSMLEVPSLGIKRGILDIDSKYNDVKYNIELIKDSDNEIILASHNGNNYNSYFGNLYKLQLGDYINYYKDGEIYMYIYSNSYEIEKNGSVDIFCNNDKKCIALITCKNGSDNSQVVHIGYLEKISNYNKG